MDKRVIEMEMKPNKALFDVQAVNPRYRGAWMSDVALALVRPRNRKVAAMLEARRNEGEDG